MRAERAVLGAVAACVIALALPACARAQGLLQRLGLDRLRFSGIGVSYGPTYPQDIRTAESYGVEVDYGEIARHYHVLFDVSYWGSRYTDRAVNGFVRQLRQSVVDPAGDDTIRTDHVRVSDVALEGEVRWTPASRSAVTRPYLGGGLGMHFVSARSRLIDGTFVGDALNAIALGVTAVAGVEFDPSRRFGVGVEGRYTLVPNVQYGTVRAVVTYHFSRDAQGPTP